MSRLGARLAILLVIFAFGTWAAWAFVVDDAYITFRYSAHFAEGHGPVWNVGGDPVEGFTNFGWMSWLAFLGWMQLDLLLVAKVTSLVIAVIILVLLVRETEDGAWLAGGAFVVFLPTYFHLSGGLETVAFAAVVLRAAIVGIRVLQDKRVWDWEPPALLLIAGLLRPEGVLATLPAVAIWFWYERDRPGPKRALIAAAVLGAVYFGWRWIYYGQFLPNTFYVKFGDLTAGGEWTKQTLGLFLPLLLLTLGLLIRKETRAIGGLLIAMVVLTCVTYALSGPSMDYLGRFAYHAFPVLCLGAGFAVTEIGNRWVAIGVSTVAVGWVAATGATAKDLPTMANYGTDLRRAHVAIGEGLASADVPAEFRTIAVSDAGAIPYFSGWNAIDYIGLNDEAIAGGADPTDVVKAASPMVIVVTSYTPEIPDVMYGLRVAEATEGYVDAVRVQMREGYWQHVFVKTGWAPQVGDAVRASVEEAQRTIDPGRYEVTVDRWLDRLRTGRD
ncbi:hypothetical protein ABZ639_24555 [Saccharomonospora sp. NPDC006951]